MRTALGSPLGRARGALALLAVALLAACGGAEGESRPLTRTWDGPGGAERVRGIEVYHDGAWVPHGEILYFDREGEVMAEGRMEYGLETGFWREYYREDDGGAGSGEYRDGKRHGEWSYFYPEGTRHQRGAYVDGRRHGLWTEWYAEGKLRSEIEWQDGERHGRATFRNLDGTLDTQRSGTYERGVKVD